MENNSVMLSYIDNSALTNTKKSIRKLLNPKRSSNLVRSVLTVSSKPQNSYKVQSMKKKEIIRYQYKNANNENFSTFESFNNNTFEKKLTAAKEGQSPENKSSINFDFKLNLRLRNDNGQSTSVYCSESESLNLGTEKIGINGEIDSKFFYTNENLGEEIKIMTEMYGTQSLFCADNNLLRDFKDGEYIFDDCIKILNFIAEGAQARIYLGLIEEIDKYVAVKRMDIIYDKTLLERVEQECEMVKNMEHPNILKYFDIEITAEGMEDDLEDVPPTMCKIDIIMEYIDGMNLKEFIIKEGNVPIEKTRLMITKILEGLVYLHENKIIHRDLKVKFKIIY
jgi:hypothetical protein